MKRDDYEKFENIIKEFLKTLEERYKIYPSIILEPSQEYPELKCKFKAQGLRKWTMGIWPTGKWSEFYGTDTKENKIAVFLIHDWTLDKFRPSSADILYEIRIDNKNIYSEIAYITDEVNEIKKNPIQTYYRISRTTQNPFLVYFRNWWFDKKFKVSIKMKYTIGPKILYGIMKFISLFDHRVEKVEIFDEPETIPRYTFGFLATREFSEESDDKFERFYNLYSRFPEWLSRKLRIDAKWNVSDFLEDLNEKQLRTRLFKGIYIKK